MANGSFLSLCRRYHYSQYVVLFLNLIMFLLGCKLLSLLSAFHRDAGKLEGNLEAPFNAYEGQAVVLFACSLFALAGVCSANCLRRMCVCARVCACALCVRRCVRPRMADDMLTPALDTLNALLPSALMLVALPFFGVGGYVVCVVRDSLHARARSLSRFLI